MRFLVCIQLASYESVAEWLCSRIDRYATMPCYARPMLFAVNLLSRSAGVTLASLIEKTGLVLMGRRVLVLFCLPFFVATVTVLRVFYTL